MPQQREFRLDPATEGILAAREDDRRRQQRATIHYHVSPADARPIRDNHPGGGRRHTHKGLVGYGMTRESITFKLSELSVPTRKVARKLNPQLKNSSVIGFPFRVQLFRAIRHG